MQTADIIILVVLLCGLIVGFKKGLFNQLASLCGVIIGIAAAWMFYSIAAEWIAPYVGGGTMGTVVAFVVIWLVVYLIVSILVKGVGKAVDMVHLGFLNHLLGGVLGVAKYVLLLCIAVWVLDSFDKDSRLVSEDTKSSSIVYAPIQKLNAYILPYVQDFIQKKMPGDVQEKVQKPSEEKTSSEGGLL